MNVVMYKYFRDKSIDTKKRIKGDSRLSFRAPYRFGAAIRRVVKNELIASSVPRYASK